MRHHSRTSPTEAGRTPFSIWETFDAWQPAAAAKARPVSPAARRSSRSLPPRRCRAAWRLEDEGGITTNQSPPGHGGTDCRGLPDGCQGRYLW